MSPTKPPDGGYGWIIALVVMLNFFNCGVTFASFGVLYKDLVEYFEEGIAQVGLLISLEAVLTNVSGNIEFNIKRSRSDS